VDVNIVKFNTIRQRIRKKLLTTLFQSLKLYFVPFWSNPGPHLLSEPRIVLASLLIAVLVRRSNLMKSRWRVEGARHTRKKEPGEDR